VLILRKVAVTGGIASGKSTVCKFFGELGACTVSCDDIVRELLTVDSPVGPQVIQLLGPNIVLSPTGFDRKKIAAKVFADKTLLDALESILHPTVRQRVQQEFERASPSFPLFVVEVPLLFETGSESWYDATVTVVASEKTMNTRFLQRSGAVELDFQQRMARQMPAEEKAKRAAYLVFNDGTLEALRQQVQSLFHKLVEM
jgi:dephospho-CoA kinase